VEWTNFANYGNKITRDAMAAQSRLKTHIKIISELVGVWVYDAYES